jgi:hypothetical protein
MEYPIRLTRIDGDNQPRIQDAVNACKEAGGGAVFLDGGNAPTDAWRVDRPVIIHGSNVTLYGRGQQTMLTSANTFDPVALGVGVGQGRKVNEPWPAAPTWHTFADADHWVGASPYLDASAGQRHAIRTRSASSGLYSHPTFPDSPFNCGPAGGWGSVRKLTIEAGFVCHQFAHDGLPLFGSQTWDLRPEPIYCNVIGGLYTALYLRFTDYDQFRVRLLQGNAGWLPQLGTYYNLKLQLDLGAGTCLCWANGQRVATTTDGVPLAGRVLVEKHTNSTFHLGGLSPDDYSFGYSVGGRHDTTFAGLRFTAASVYADAPTLTRLDGQPADDFHSYFAPSTAATIGWLPLDQPADPDRLVPWRGPPVPGIPPSYGFGWMLREIDGGGEKAVGRCTVRDLWLQCRAPYGSACRLGAGFFVTFDRVTFTGGAFGLAGSNNYVSYPITVRDCEFSHSAVAGLVLSGSSNVVVSNGHWPNYGRHAMVFQGVNALVDRPLVNGVDGCDSVVLVKSNPNKGGTYRFQGGLFDFEETRPGVAYVDAERNEVVPQTSLVFEQVALGRSRAGATAFVLRTTQGQAESEKRPGFLRLKDVAWWGDLATPPENGAGAVRLAGPGWSVACEGKPPDGAPLVAIDSAGNEVEDAPPGRGFALADNCQYWGDGASSIFQMVGNSTSWAARVDGPVPEETSLVIDEAGGTIEE